MLVQKILPLLKRYRVIAIPMAGAIAIYWPLPARSLTPDAGHLDPQGAIVTPVPFLVQADSAATETTPQMLEDTMNLGLMDKATGQIQQLRKKEFENYFKNPLPQILVTNDSFRDILKNIAKQTEKKPAVIYTFVFPDHLELVLYTPDNQPIRHLVKEANKEALFSLIQKFRNEVTNPAKRITNTYLPPAKQLYQLLIAPLASELKSQGIDTLLFSMDEGLRSFPIAALHDGKQFLVEQYSIGLIPCISLTDTRYASLQNDRVLAMGASQFSDLAALPAVSVELKTITSSLWPGQAFLNQEFTLENLKLQRQNTPYKIIHLATHAEFQSGVVSNSYIQLWDTKLRLDQIGQLKFNDPTVELLVLSACRTAVGDANAELGFAGLAVQSGVKSVLASLWYVSDVGTLGLMTEFYEHLSKAPIKAEALREAQLAMLRSQVRVEAGQLRGTGVDVKLPPELATEGDFNLSHPYYWSGFTMIGSPW